MPTARSQSGHSERFAKDEHNGGAPVCLRQSLRNYPLKHLLST
jgi:hypothetical protein